MFPENDFMLPLHAIAQAARYFTVPLGVALLLSLAACGGGGDAGDGSAELLAADEASGTKSALALSGNRSATNTLEVDLTISGHPHKVDVYRPAGATRAIVFLHGHGGRKWQMAYDLGLNRRMAPPSSRSVDWSWLALNGVIAVFPQGQVKAGSTQPTWSNYVMDSGQDDVAFLQALSSYVKSQYGVREVSLSGHSAGGTMSARIWCEATTSYKTFVSMAGPMPSATYPVPSPTCTPLSMAPYYAIMGGKDSTLPKFQAGTTAPTPEQVAAGLTEPYLVSEWVRDRDRGQRICGETTGLGDATAAASGPTWSNCTARVKFTVVSNADHPIASLAQYAGVRMVDMIAGFAK